MIDSKVNLECYNRKSIYITLDRPHHHFTLLLCPLFSYVSFFL